MHPRHRRLLGHRSQHPVFAVGGRVGRLGASRPLQPCRSERSFHAGHLHRGDQWRRQLSARHLQGRAELVRESKRAVHGQLSARQRGQIQRHRQAAWGGHRRAFRCACDARPGGFLATARAGGSRYGRAAAEALRPAGFLSCRAGERPSGCRASRSISATVIRSKISDMASRTLVMVRRTAQALTSLQSRHG
jgi:hypothetical protein